MMDREAAWGLLTVFCVRDKMSAMKPSIAALAIFCCLAAGTVPAQSQCAEPPAVLSAQYFPSGVFDTSAPSTKGNWYACTLGALNEPSLFALRNDKSIQVYRFLWLPSFHRPISVRLTVNADGTGSIVTRSVDSHAGLLTKPASDTGKVIRDETSVIDEDQVKEVLVRLQGFSFWSMPTEDEQAAFGEDGAQWILEGLRRGEYHVVDRWSPKDDSYSALCKYLLHLAKVETTLY